MTLSISQVGRMGGRGLVRWSRGSASRTVAAAVATSSVVGAARLRLVAGRRLRAHPAERARHDRRDAQEDAGRRSRITARQDSRLAGPHRRRRVAVPDLTELADELHDVGRDPRGEPREAERNHGLAQETKDHRDHHRDWGADRGSTDDEPRIDEHDHRALAGDDACPYGPTTETAPPATEPASATPTPAPNRQQTARPPQRRTRPPATRPRQQTARPPRRPGRDDRRRSYGALWTNPGVRRWGEAG